MKTKYEVKKISSLSVWYQNRVKRVRGVQYSKMYILTFEIAMHERDKKDSAGSKLFKNFGTPKRLFITMNNRWSTPRFLLLGIRCGAADLDAVPIPAVLLYPSM